MMQYLLDPFLVFFSLTILAVISLWRGGNSRRRLWFLTIAVVGLVLVCTPAVSFLALGSLEWWYPQRFKRPADAEAIVVLSGRLRPLDPAWTRVDLGEDTFYRTLLARRIYRNSGRCPVLVSGGKVDANRPGPPLAQAMADFLSDYGVREEDLIVEDRSQTTYENAVESARLLRERGIKKVALVTEAIHLWRAERCFQAQGIEIVPCGAMHRALDFEWSARSFLPRTTAAKRNEQVLHEWIGLVWYRVNGWI